MECNCDYIMETKPAWEKHYSNCRTVWDLTKKGPYPKNKDGSLILPNPHLKQLKTDNLYHLGMATDTHDLQAMFGDVKFVCMGGTKYRMRDFAEYLHEILDIKKEAPKLVNLTKHSHRYAMYKVGPVLSVSHGIGIPSMTILLQEVLKLLQYAGAKDPVFFRIGTSGGLGVEPGSVVVSQFGLNACLEKTFDLPILGKIHKFPSLFDTRLAQELMSCTRDDDQFAVITGGTMAADDFYRGQGRTDGPFCHHSDADRLAFLQELMAAGVRNIEMEATAFAAMTTEAGVRASDVCVTLVDRLQGDQVTPKKATLTDWQKRPMLIVGRYIAQYWTKNKL